MTLSRANRDLQIGDEKVTLNHLVVCFSHVVLLQLKDPIPFLAQPLPFCVSQTGAVVFWIHGEEGGRSQRSLRKK